MELVLVEGCVTVTLRVGVLVKSILAWAGRLRDHREHDHHEEEKTGSHRLHRSLVALTGQGRC